MGQSNLRLLFVLLASSLTKRWTKAVAFSSLQSIEECPPLASNNILQKPEKSPAVQPPQAFLFFVTKPKKKIYKNCITRNKHKINCNTILCVTGTYAGKRTYRHIKTQYISGHRLALIATHSLVGGERGPWSIINRRLGK